MIGQSSLLIILTIGLLVPLVPLVGLLIYLTIRYCPVIERIFQERPMFLPLRITPDDRGELVLFPSRDGLLLSGSYLRSRTTERVGVLVFCHEYLSDRWSYLPYADHLRDVGFDLFSFDFRNHGQSSNDPTYSPLQWVTDHEVRDLKGALEYLRSRPDHDPAGFGLLGVSRGGSTALLVGAEERDVWGVVTDGAFPTRGTMTTYMYRWAEIYVHSEFFLKLIPGWIYGFLGWIGRRRSQRRLNCRFPDVETAVSRLAPRPLLMIHGERDAYIGPKIARELFEHAREPKALWLVPEAKHNRCREVDPEAYAARLLDFLGRYAPRRPIQATLTIELRGKVEDFIATPGLPLQAAKLVTNVGC